MQFAAVAATFIAALAAQTRAQDTAAQFLELLSRCIEKSCAAGDSLGSHNLVSNGDAPARGPAFCRTGKDKQLVKMFPSFASTMRMAIACYLPYRKISC